MMGWFEMQKFNPYELTEENYAIFMGKWALTVIVNWHASTDPIIHQLYSKEKGKAGLNGFALVLGQNGSKLEIEDNFGMETSKIFYISARDCIIGHSRVYAKPELQDIFFHEFEEEYVKQFPKSFELWSD